MKAERMAIMAMGDVILFAAAAIGAAMLILAFLARRWTGVGVAALAFLIAYAFFFLLCVFAALTNVPPVSGRAGATPGLYGPWIAVAAPVLPAALSSLVLIAWIGDGARFRRFVPRAGTFLRAAAATVAVAAAAYVAGSLFEWPHIDDVVSIALLTALVAIATLIAIVERSLLTFGALLVLALPCWFLGVMVARWSVLVPAFAMYLWRR